MNKDINLCEILKGHEGETFYSSICGTIVLLRINSDGGIIFESLLDQCVPYAFNEDGTFISGAECVIFPSKDQRDWNKWIEEQKPKVPKTWGDVINQYKTKTNTVKINTNCLNGYCGNSPIEKSALAFLKIHQLIEAGYGGNVSYEEWNLNSIKYIIDCNKNNFYITPCNNVIHHIAFHTREQAEDFLSYPENVQLLKDYFMI